MTFDPSPHLIKMKGGALYLPVKHRLMWAREQHPDMSVEVELVHLDLDGKLAVARATVTLPNGTKASDIGSETEKDFPAGWVEKAATKAVGRALASLGFGTEFALELEEGERVADSPVASVAASERQGAPDTAARVPSRRLASPAAPRPTFTEQAAAALTAPPARTGPAQSETDGALLSGLRAEVAALLEHDGVALDLLRANGTLPPKMSAEQLRKTKDWLIERERRNVPLSERLSRAIDGAKTPEELRGSQQAVQKAKDDKAISQQEYVGLLREVESRRQALCAGPLTAQATGDRRQATEEAAAEERTAHAAALSPVARRLSPGRQP